MMDTRVSSCTRTFVHVGVHVNAYYSHPPTHTHTLRRLRVLLQQLDQGDLPNVLEMKKTLSYAADVLLGLVPRPISEEEDE